MREQGDNTGLFSCLSNLINFILFTLSSDFVFLEILIFPHTGTSHKGLEVSQLSNGNGLCQRNELGVSHNPSMHKAVLTHHGNYIFFF